MSTRCMLSCKKYFQHYLHFCQVTKFRLFTFVSKCFVLPMQTTDISASPDAAKKFYCNSKDKKDSWKCSLCELSTEDDNKLSMMITLSNEENLGVFVWTEQFQGTIIGATRPFLSEKSRFFFFFQHPKGQDPTENETCSVERPKSSPWG